MSFMSALDSVMDLQSDVDTHVAAAAGVAARAALQGAHVTKQDLKDEAHRLENGAGILFGVWLALTAAVALGAIVWAIPSGKRA